MRFCLATFGSFVIKFADAQPCWDPVRQYPAAFLPEPERHHQWRPDPAGLRCGLAADGLSDYPAARAAPRPDFRPFAHGDLFVSALPPGLSPPQYQRALASVAS